MTVYLGKVTETATGDMTATHSTIINFTCEVEVAGQKVPMNNFFPPHPHFLMT